MDGEYHGTGFSTLRMDNGRIVNLRNAIKSAKSDCIRDACDNLEMGWIDLADFRDWAKNPGIGMDFKRGMSESRNSSEQTCTVCQKNLDHDDIRYLSQFPNIDRWLWCKEHLPMHMKR